MKGPDKILICIAASYIEDRSCCVQRKPEPLSGKRCWREMSLDHLQTNLEMTLRSALGWMYKVENSSHLSLLRDVISWGLGIAYEQSLVFLEELKEIQWQVTVDRHHIEHGRSIARCFFPRYELCTGLATRKKWALLPKSQHWRWGEQKPVCANSAPGKWAGWGWTDKVELPTPSPKYLWKSGKVKGMQSKICALTTSFLRASNGVKLRYLPGDAFTMYCNVKQYSTMKSPMIILVCPIGCCYYGIKEKYELDTDVIGKWQFP